MDGWILWRIIFGIAAFVGVWGRKEGMYVEQWSLYIYC